jgi:6-phosphogluconate dehydrogenase
LKCASIKKPSDLIKDKKVFLEQVRLALYASKIVSYTQGFMLLSAASKEFNWKLNMGAIALMWRGGCIIRSRFLGRIKQAFDSNPNLINLMLDNFFLESITNAVVSF